MSNQSTLEKADPISFQWGRLLADPGSWWVVAVCVFVCLPLWLVRFVPADDLPGHAAIALAIWKLLHQDPGIATYYALRLQPLPYYLAYALLTPCVGLWGPVWGVKVALSVCGCATVVATNTLRRVLQAPHITLIIAFFAFYSLSFYWGFISTLVGLPTTVTAYALLLRWYESRRVRFLLAAGLAGFISMTAHVIWVAPVVVATCIAACLMARQRAFRVGIYLFYAGSGTLAVMGLLAGRIHLSAVPRRWLGFETSPVFAGYTSTYLGGWIDAWWPATCHLLILALFLLWNRLQPLSESAHRKDSRLLVHWLIALVYLHLALPNAVEIGAIHIWFLGFRYLPLMEIVAVMIVTRGRRNQRSVSALITMCLALYILPMAQLWRSFDAEARQVETLLRTIPPGRTMYVDRTLPPVYTPAWPPLTAHLPDQYLSYGGAFVSGLFEEKHIPLVVVQEPRGGLQPSGAFCMQDYDFMMQFVGSLSGTPGPADGVLQAAACGWVLYRSIHVQP